MKLLRCLAAAASLFLAGVPAQADDPFPAPGRPVQLVYPFGAGGTDTLFRAFAQAMGTESGGRFVVMNREGASGAIGATSVARAKPDGYTLLIGPSIMLTNLPYTQKDLSYDIDSFEFVCQMTVNAFALVVKADSPYRTLNDLLAAARQNPGKFNYGHSGTYTDFHLNVLNLGKHANVQWQDVAYRGDAANLMALLAGDLQFTANSVISVASRKDVRPLAVFWDRRHPALPDVPAITELGVPNFFVGYQGVFAPKGTPRPVLQRLSSLCEKALQASDYQTVARNQQAVVVYQPSEEFAKATRAAYVTKGNVFRELGVKPQ